MTASLPPLRVVRDPDGVGGEDDRHLYAMTAPSALARNLWKVGVASDVLRRERQLSCGQPEELRACFVWPNEAALEDYVLRMLPSPGGGARGREWRVATEEQLFEAVRLAREEHGRLRDLPAPVQRPKRQLESLMWRLDALSYAPRPTPYALRDAMRS